MADPLPGSPAVPPSPVTDARVGSLAELYRDSYGAMVRLAYLLTDSNALARKPTNCGTPSPPSRTGSGPSSS